MGIVVNNTLFIYEYLINICILCRIVKYSFGNDS